MRVLQSKVNTKTMEIVMSVSLIWSTFVVLVSFRNHFLTVQSKALLWCWWVSFVSMVCFRIDPKLTRALFILFVHSRVCSLTRFVRWWVSSAAALDFIFFPQFLDWFPNQLSCNFDLLPRRVCCAWLSAMPVQHARATEQAQVDTSPIKN